MKNNICFIMVFVFALAIIAPACGFAWGSNYSIVEICGAQGLEKRIVQDDSAPAEHRTNDQCQFCFANTHLIKDVPPAKITSITMNFTAHQYSTYFETTILNRLYTPHNSRAPPSLV